MRSCTWHACGGNGAGVRFPGVAQAGSKDFYLNPGRGVMADRTSAAAFGEIFSLLAANPKKNKALAKKILALTDNFDFSPYQMDCDPALKKLGLYVKEG